MATTQDTSTMDDVAISNAEKGIGEKHEKNQTSLPKMTFSRSVATCLTAAATPLKQNTTSPKLVMWGYLGWYITVVLLVPNKTSKPFIDALIIMLLIGFVLNANAYLAFRAAAERCPRTGELQTTMGWYMKLNYASALRLFLIPYCVSSYSGMAASVSSMEDAFASVFPRDPSIWIPAICIGLGFPLFLFILRYFTTGAASPSPEIEIQEKRSSSSSHG